MRGEALKRGLVCILSDYAVDLAATIVAFAGTGKTDWKMFSCPSWYLYYAGNKTIFPSVNSREKV